MQIRPASPADYPAIARLHNAATPHYGLTVEQLQQRDQTRDPRCKLGYFIAEDDQQIAGYGGYAQWGDMYHPQLFHVTVQVDPVYQRQGIGTRLHQHLLDTLNAFDPICFKASIYDDDPAAMLVSQRWGYQVYSRRIESALDVLTCDLSSWQPRLEAFASSGLQLVPISAFMDDETALRAIYDLQWTLEFDVPLAETLTQPDFDQWRKSVVDHPSFVAGASWVAVSGDQMVAVSEVFRYSDARLYIEFTGTLPDFRRRGIAFAMKARLIEWARTNGYQQIGTTNDAINTGIIALNRSLGFVPAPARLQIEKVFAESGASQRKC